MAASSSRLLANGVMSTSAAGTLLGGDVTDAALLTPNAPTGLEGITSFESFLAKGTPEIQQLLRNECDVIFECRFCRNLFRSVINFTAHKRSYCRGSFRALQAAAEPTPSMPDANIDEEDDNASSTLAASSSGPVAFSTRAGKRAPPQLRRVNLVTTLSKKSDTKTLAIDGTQHKLDLHTLPRVAKEVPVTEIDNGQQIITTHLASTLALRAAATEVAKADRTLIVVPSQPITSRIRRQLVPQEAGAESNSRTAENGTAAGTSSGPTVLTHASMTVLENLTKWASDVTNVATLRCLNPVCREVPAFESVELLALHITLQHIRRRGVNRRLLCLLCTHNYKSYKTLCDHLDRDHAHIKSVDRPSAENPHCPSPYEPSANKASDQPPPVKMRRNPRATAATTSQQSQQHAIKSLLLRQLFGDGEEAEGAGDRAEEPLTARSADQVSWRIVSSATRLRVLPVSEVQCRASTVPDDDVQYDAALEPQHELEMVDVEGDEQAPELERMERQPKEEVDVEEEEDADEEEARVEPFQLGDEEDDELEKSRGIGEDERSCMMDVEETYDEQQDDDEDVAATLNSVLDRICGPEEESAKEEEGEEEKMGDEQTLGAVAKELPRRKRGRPKKYADDGSLLATGDARKKQTNGKNEEEDDETTVRVNRHDPLKMVFVRRNTVTSTAGKQTSEGGRDRRDRSIASASSDARDEKDENQRDEDASSPAATRGRDMGTRRSSTRHTKRPAWMGDYVEGEAQQEAAATAAQPVPKPEESSAKTSDVQKVRKKPGRKRKNIAPEEANKIVKKLKTKKTTTTIEKEQQQQRRKIKTEEVDPEDDKFELPPQLAQLVAAAAAEAAAGKAGGGGGGGGGGRRKPRTTDGEDVTKMERAQQQQQQQRVERGEEEEPVLVLSPLAGGRAPPKPADLSEVPLRLRPGEHEQLFDHILEEVPNTLFRCAHCRQTAQSRDDARRHAVSHVRVHRFRCTGCTAGSFYLADLRAHLMTGKCGANGGGRISTPAQADALIELADPLRPGGCVFTSALIVAQNRPIAFLPDPVIEESILQARIATVGTSPRKAALPSAAVAGSSSSNYPTSTAARRLTP